MSRLRRLARGVLRLATVNQALRVLARARGRRLVLVYHRLGSAVPKAVEIVPSVPVEVFRAQLELLREVVDFVTLDELIEWETPRARTAADPRRPAVAVTFDDDLTSHVEHALPILCELKVPAAFFLSGRAVNGRGAYWFQQLEALLATHGPAHTASLLGMPAVAWNSSFVHRCERDSSLRRRMEDASAGLPGCEVLDRAGMATLAAAGMMIGFHTVSHRILPDLDDAAIDDAVTRGRAELAAAIGEPVEYFAYPYGRFDSRSAAAVRRAGFRAAFAGRPVAVRRGDDLYCLGRWEPGPTAGDDLLVKLTIRLHRHASSAVHGW